MCSACGVCAVLWARNGGEGAVMLSGSWTNGLYGGQRNCGTALAESGSSEEWGRATTSREQVVFRFEDTNIPNMIGAMIVEMFTINM